MKKNLICIECPQGCHLIVEIENGKAVKIEGNKCPKGENYAQSEIENPVRVLTTTVATKGLDAKMVSVRTDRAIPKARMIEAMREVKKLRVSRAVKVGDAVEDNLLGLGVKLLATREIA